MSGQETNDGPPPHGSLSHTHPAAPLDSLSTSQSASTPSNNGPSASSIPSLKQAFGGLPPVPQMMNTGTKNLLTGTTSSTLPPPPKFHSLTNANSVAASKPVSLSAPNSSSSSLPPPPQFSMPVSFNASSSRSNNMISTPTQQGNATSNSNTGNPKDTNFTNHEKNNLRGSVNSVHSTTEQIPPLASAPNSGGSILKEAMAYSDEIKYDNIGASNELPTSSTATDYFASAAATDGSSENWSQWGGNLIEKAGQLSYSMVESAADLVESRTQASDNSAPLTKIQTNASQSVMADMGTPEPSGPPRVEHHLQYPSPPRTKYHPTKTDRKVPTPASPRGEDQGIEVGADGRAPSASPLRKPPGPSATKINLVPHPPINLNVDKKTKQIRRRALASPPLTSLAARQSRLAVLIVPTADSQSIASKNNTTLAEMFRVFGNSHSQLPMRGMEPESFQPSKADSSLEPPLPPFRSAHRSMILHWDQIVLNFVSFQDMENMPVAEAESERALGEAARLWDEDRLGHGEEDAEMDQLEKCVAEALAEEEEEEWMRKANGIPSMTSLPPSRSSQDTGGDDAEGNDHEYALASDEKEDDALETCANAAFALTSLPTAPWLARFRHTLDCTTDGMGHDMMCNPSIVILMASSSEPFLNCFAELANVHHLPRPYHDGRYDPNGLRREFLLLHDVVNGPQQFDEARALSQMRERFGPGCCSVLRLNSMPPVSGATEDEDAAWESAGPTSPFVEGSLSQWFKPSASNEKDTPTRGVCLSQSDKRAIRRYIANMVATGLVPAVERRIANLNAAVTNAKKGVKNVIKSFWRKPKENLLVNVSGYADGGASRRDSNSNDPTSGGGSVRYRFESIESQARLLADTLFLMRDYDAALSVYKLVKDDYKHDKSMLHYASAQEMIVLCMHMLDPFGRESRFASDVHHSIETALYSYTRAADDEREAEESSGVRPGEAPYATRLATRLCLVLSATRALCEGKHMEIADLLASASSHETPLGAAVLLEQSSSHYYRAGMLRKYAFHMLMSGHMFRSAGQERHAFRCFSASLYVYHGERWEELRSHLRSALAAQLYGMGRYALSMQFYSKLISMTGGGRVSVRSQQKFLNHIVDICTDHESSALLAVDRMNHRVSGNQASGSSVCVDDILKGFSGAVRQVEIINVGFPRVHDSSISVRVDNTGDSSTSFGHSDSFAANVPSGKGDESIWQKMTNYAEAELRASAMASTASSIDNPSKDGGPEPPPVHSGNETIDRVIMEIDKEERDAEYRARLKRKGNAGSPEVRATSEPLAVSFSLSNPLGLDIELTDIQLVASLACQKSGTIHTNEFSVSGRDMLDLTKGKNWKFHGSEKDYLSPEFLCQHPILSETPESCVSIMDGVASPFFVVTRSRVKMKSNSKTVVTLNICPLAEGDFKILGVRFKLLDEVWIYHRFDLPGPLLQDTRVNRARRARGESLILRSKVEEEMPFLKATITPNRTDPNTQGALLQGQTSSWTLKLSNLGYAPACNITLKTNSPWLNINNLDETGKQEENGSTSFCVGPSGTLIKVPFKTSRGNSAVKNAEQLGILQPGETVEVPVIIRTSGGGRQDFYMLFRYELWTKDYSSSNLIPRHRWARKLISFPVYPSITMSASLMPSYSNKGEHILSVELMNYRSDRESNLEIYLDKIFIASRHFEVRQMLGQVDPSDVSTSLISNVGNGSLLSSLKIGWQERVTLHYLVIPLEKSKPSFTLSMLSFSSGNQAESESLHEITQRYGAKVTDFMCRERAHDAFSSTLQSHNAEKGRMMAEQEKEGAPRHVAQIRRARTSLPKEESNNFDANSGQSQDPISLVPITPATVHPTSIASLCPIDGSSNINIICCWSASVGNEILDETIYGQHHLRNLLVRPQYKSKGCPLALTSKHAAKASHNFIGGPLDVDLEITIRNRLVETKVEFEFALDHQPGFDFVGATCFKWVLAGGEEITVPLKARFYCRGVYNLQSVRLTVLKTDMTVPYLFPLQWTIDVEEF